jgi:hypothetical protein
MSLSRTGLDHFRTRVEETLAELFPTTIHIHGTPIPAMTVGAREMTRWEDTGEANRTRITFRVDKALLPQPLRMALPLEWQDGETLRPLEISEYSSRPADTHHTITCIRRRQ